MSWHDAVIGAIQQDNDACTIWIDCPTERQNLASAIPAVGQYVQAHFQADPDAPQAITLFPVEIRTAGFRALLPSPLSADFKWGRFGARVSLRGPLGHGFTPPAHLRHLLLAAAGETIQRLHPLIEAYTASADIVLCTDLPAMALPSSIEIYPLHSLAELLSWSDYLALDVLLADLPHLRTRLGLTPQTILPCPAQALVITPMPCGALAECGACATPAQHGYKLACKDGPVFDLRELAW